MFSANIFGVGQFAAYCLLISLCLCAAWHHHRLADALGSSGWLYVVDAVNALDRILASPHTTTAAYLMVGPEGRGGEGDGEYGTFSAVSERKHGGGGQVGQGRAGQ